MCRAWAEEVGAQGGAESMRRYMTPSKERPDGGDDRKSAQPGRFAARAPAHVGKILWASRGSRPDVAQALLRLQRRIHGWSDAEDEALHRIYAYIFWTRDVGAWLLVDCDPRARDVRRLLCWPDADHGNDPAATTRSTSAGAVSIASSWPVSYTHLTLPTKA